MSIGGSAARSEEHTSELQSRSDRVCRLLLEKKKQATNKVFFIDFGLASEGNIINEEPDSFHEKEIDILKYIAPEQTGRINRPIVIFAVLRRPPRSPLFPYTTLFR